jgi:hypothetical protein
MKSLISRRALLFFVPAGLALAGVATAGFLTFSVPDNLDLSLAKLSDGGLYHVELMPDASPIGVGKMHVWTVQLETASGAPVTQADFVISGGMPQHGHGLPTAPKVTKSLGEGRFQIEGVKFNMGGWWTFKLDVRGAVGTDAVTFNLVL